HDMDSVDTCRTDLTNHIRSAVSNPADADNPVSTTIDLISLKSSDPASANIVSYMADMFQTVFYRIDMLQATLYRPTLGPWIGPGASALFRNLLDSITLRKGERPTRARLQAAERAAQQLGHFLRDILIIA